MSAQPFVIVHNLTKKYAKSPLPVISDVSFKVEKGKICSIIGRSGAGKSTLLRCLNALESFDSGTIKIGDAFLEKAREKDRRTVLKQVGTVFQSFNLLSRRTVLENILLPTEWEKIPKDKAKEKAILLAEKVGLIDKLADKLNSYAKGEE